jgi:subtilisin family serine protease
VAGTAAGTCYGVAKKAIINPVKVLGDNGSGSYSGIISGIRWATDNAKANKWRGVINMSLGGGSSSSLNAAVQTAVNQGMVVAVAAGNDRAANACTKSPASAPPALTVASVTSKDTASSFSNVGSCVDIWAPGDRIASANSADYNGYTFLSGTSMATPHVAGAAAIALERNSRASPDQVAQTLARVSVKRNLYPGTTQNLLQVRGL